MDILWSTSEIYSMSNDVILYCSTEGESWGGIIPLIPWFIHNHIPFIGFSPIGTVAAGMRYLCTGAPGAADPTAGSHSGHRRWAPWSCGCWTCEACSHWTAGSPRAAGRQRTRRMKKRRHIHQSPQKNNASFFFFTYFKPGNDSFFIKNVIIFQEKPGLETLKHLKCGLTWLSGFTKFIFHYILFNNIYCMYKRIYSFSVLNSCVKIRDTPCYWEILHNST